MTYGLFDLGAQGVSENLSFIQTSLQYDPEIIEMENVVLEAFFAFKDKEKIETLISSKDYQKFEPRLLLEKNKDWLLEWKKHYKPFSVCGDLWIYPSWEKDNVQAGQEVILVDPGLAFGTGTHETTELCLKALSKTLKEGHGFETALDMGAGTGILTSLMYKRGIHASTACEIDEMAREKCSENLVLNSCEGVKVVGPEDLTKETYDLVVANIIDGVLLKLKKELSMRTNKKLILSGILIENEAHVLREFLLEGLELFERTVKSEWVCLEFEKIKTNSKSELKNNA